MEQRKTGRKGRSIRQSLRPSRASFFSVRELAGPELGLMALSTRQTRSIYSTRNQANADNLPIQHPAAPLNGQYDPSTPSLAKTRILASGRAAPRTPTHTPMPTHPRPCTRAWGRAMPGSVRNPFFQGERMLSLTYCFTILLPFPTTLLPYPFSPNNTSPKIFFNPVRF